MTHTTRPKRHNEVAGVDYYFETDASMQQKHLIESVTYSGYRYGSSHEALALAWDQAPIISLVVDTQGAKTYLETYPDEVLVLFLTVSAPDALVARLQKRKDTPEAIQKRIASAEFKRDLMLPTTLNQQAKIIVNDDWSKTKQVLAELMTTLQ